MRQTIKIENPLASIASQQQQPLEVTLEFPLFRRQTKSDSWRTDITLTRIASPDGSAVSLRYIKGVHHDQETVELTRGIEKLDTGILDLTRGIGEYAASEAEFVQLAALGAQLLANITADVGPIPGDAAEVLLNAVARVKSNGRESRGSLRQQ